jgi:predicted TIM-barrel fold metal-dependent hydrolase
MTDAQGAVEQTAPRPAAGVRNDAHTHVGMATDVRPGSEAEALVLAMDAAAVRRAAIITPSTVNGDNSATFDALRAFPSRFVAIALVDWTGPEPRRAAAAAIAAGASGIRFNLVSEPLPELLLDDKLDHFWNLLAERGTVALFHSHAGQLDLVGRLALRHPHLVILIDHLGRPDVAAGPDSEGFVALLRLASLTNVSVKTPNSSFFSAAPPPHTDLTPFLEAALREFGSARVLWGSDWPVCTLEEPYAAASLPTDAALASATQAERDAVFGGNFDRIFGYQDTSTREGTLRP